MQTSFWVPEDLHLDTDIIAWPSLTAQKHRTVIIALSALHPKTGLDGLWSMQAVLQAPEAQFCLSLGSVLYDLPGSVCTKCTVLIGIQREHSQGGH